MRPSSLLGAASTGKPEGRSTRAGRDAAGTKVLPLAEVEQRHIESSLQNLDNNLTHTAKALGISLSTLKRKLKAYSTRRALGR